LRERVFYSTTERPATHAISPALDRLATRVNAAGNLTSQAGTSAWNPTLVEIAVLGCHEDDDLSALLPGKPDDPEALALAMHQLRQAPDYAAALSLPLPLHLAGLAQAYVLPTLVERDGTSNEESDTPAGNESMDDPDLADAAGLSTTPEDDAETTGSV
jgi:hypothetical protein